MGIQNSFQDHFWDVPISIVYGKACHLPMDIEYRAWWAIKKLNIDLERVEVKRFLDLIELEELRNDAYLNSKIAKEISKKWHDQMVVRKHFQIGDKVRLYDSKLHIFPGKLKSRWIGSFTIHKFIPMEQWNFSAQMRTKLLK